MNEIEFIAYEIISLVPAWSSILLFSVGAIILHIKLRLYSTLTIAIGFVIAMGAHLSQDYLIQSHIAEGAGTIQSAFRRFLELMTWLQLPSLLIASLGFVWLAVLINVPKHTKPPNKSLNTDASDAGAG